MRLGIGRSVKRDAVLVRVDTDEGSDVVGWGEAHAAGCPRAPSPSCSIRPCANWCWAWTRAMSAASRRVLKMQFANHGMSAAAYGLERGGPGTVGISVASSQDIRCIACWAAARPIKAYAGGIALGWQAPESLAQEAMGLVEQGYRALKLRVGDTPARDIARVRAVRAAVGEDVDILVDANTSYRIEDVRRVMPAYEECQVIWLEGPSPPMTTMRTPRGAAGSVPLAASENHFTATSSARCWRRAAWDACRSRTYPRWAA